MKDMKADRGIRVAGKVVDQTTIEINTSLTWTRKVECGGRGDVVDDKVLPKEMRFNAKVGTIPRILSSIWSLYCNVPRGPDVLFR